MLIESIVQRAKGSFIHIEDDIYHFFTHAEGDTRHVCEVTDEDHIQTFLAIKEGYRLVKIAKKPKANVEPVVPTPAKATKPAAPPQGEGTTADPATK